MTPGVGQTFLSAAVGQTFLSAAVGQTFLSAARRKVADRNVCRRKVADRNVCPTPDAFPWTRNGMPSMNARFSLKVARPPALAAGLLFACCLAAGAEEPRSAAIEIVLVVPADARIFFDGEPTTSTGTERRYVSPPVEVGKQFQYVVLARWQEGGKPVEQSRKLPVTGGARVRVDFTQPPPQAEVSRPPEGKTDAVGTSLSAAGMLLRRDKVPGDEWAFDWKAVGEKEGLKAEALYLGLPGAFIASKNGAVRMHLRTDIDSPLPVLEPAVILHESPDCDLDFTLDRGRVDVINQKKEGPARVRIRAWGSTWEATLEAPGATLSTSLLGRWRPGTSFKKDPGPRDVPVANMLFLVLAGEVDLKHAGTLLALSAPPGPAMIGWNNFIGMDPTPERLDKLPDWAEIPRDEATRERVRKLLGIRDRLAEGIRTKGIGPTLDEFLESDDPLVRRVGVIYTGATDDLARMGKVIHESKDPGTFNDVVRVMRHWLGRAPGQDQRFYKGLIAVKNYKPVEAEGLLEMLFGFDEHQREQPALYEMLTNYLVEGRTSMRGLAHWHLVRLIPAGQKIPYDRMAPKPELEKARQEWLKLIPSPPTSKPAKKVKEAKP